MPPPAIMPVKADAARTFPQQRQTENRMSTNPWELYSSKPGWEAVAERLDCAVTDALAALDSAVAVGETAGKAAEDAFASVNAVMDREENASFGASDTEPRDHLAVLIQRHLRATHGFKDARVSRFGCVYT